MMSPTNTMPAVTKMPTINMGASGRGMPVASAPQPAAVSTWQPYVPPTTNTSIDYSRALAGYLSGNGSGVPGGGGGGLVEVHHPQDSFPYYHGGGVSVSANGGSGLGNAWGGDNASGPSGGTSAGGGGGWWSGGGYNPNAGGGGYGNSPLGALVSEEQRALNEKNAITQNLYNNNIAGYMDLLNMTKQRLANSGAQQRKDIDTEFGNLDSQFTNDWIDRGMSSSTALAGILSGNARQKENSVGDLEQRLNDQYISAVTNAQTAVLNQQERRQDTAPDFGQLAQLAQMLGLAAGANGGAGGGGFQGADVMPGAYGPDFSAMVNGGGGGFGGGGGRALTPYQQMLLAQNMAAKAAAGAPGAIGAGTGLGGLLAGFNGANNAPDFVWNGNIPTDNGVGPAPFGQNPVTFSQPNQPLFSTSQWNSMAGPSGDSFGSAVSNGIYGAYFGANSPGAAGVAGAFGAGGAAGGAPYDAAYDYFYGQ